MITFKKKNISRNNFVYEVSKNDKLFSEIEIQSNIIATITYNDLKYQIKPIVRFFTVSKFEILSEKNVKIGEIKYWG